MKLRIKEICKQKGLQLKDVADSMGIARESLTRAIHGNPQLNTLEGIAKALEVDITELFYKSNSNQITGYLECDNKIYKINHLNDLKKFMDEIERKD